jgi:type II secretory pathway component GspD/PulD (secretin)
MQLAKMSIVALLTLTACAARTFAQAAPADAKPADDKAAADAKAAAEHNARNDLSLPQQLQVFYLPAGKTQNELNDTQTALRVVVNGARVYAIPGNNEIVVAGTPAEIALAQKVFASIDQKKKLYRITYTVTDSDGGKGIGQQHFTLIVASGGKTELKEGSKVPITTGDPTQKDQIQYLDIGLNITASVDGFPDAVRLRSRVEETSLAEEKTAVSNNTGNPVIRETSLEGQSILTDGKPLVLGSLDLPGSTRHQEIEVVSELIH